MNLRIAAIIFGVVFILIGIAGFIPAFTPNHLLFGIFMVDTVHNVIHLLSGAFALFVAWKVEFADIYFKVFGITYAIVAVLGFITKDLIIIHVNTADNFLHTAIALVSLYFGFLYKRPLHKTTRRHPHPR